MLKDEIKYKIRKRRTMPTAETIKIQDKEFTARTLTVRQMVDIFENAEKKTPDLIDHLFDEGINSQVFYKSLQITLDDIGDLSPEEIPELMGAVARVNPSWAGMEKRLREAQKVMLKTLKGSPAV
jgi:hypothetical protein